jgi:hypothetical protein
LELDPDPVDSEVPEDPAGEEDAGMEELPPLTDDEARAALCNALNFHLSSCVNLIFG